MTMLFDTIRSSITALQAAEAYGLNVSRYNKARCIWHDDKNPSLSFDKRTGKCKCFVCGGGGSSIDLTAQLFNISPTEAARRLANDFHLQAEDATETTPIGPSKAQQRKEAEDWARKRWSYLCDVERAAKEELSRFPATDETWDNPRFMQLLKALGDVQIELERLWVADIEDINTIRSEVKNS